MKKTVNEILQESIRTNKDRIAFIAGGSEGEGGLTYEGLNDRVRALSLGLKRLGLKRGGRVGLISPNRHEWALSDLGVLHAGGVTVALFPTLPAEQVSYCLEDAGASVVIVSDEDQLSKVLTWARGDKTRKVIIMDAVAGGGVSGLLTLDEVMRLGEGAGGRVEGAFEALWRVVAPEDPAGIVYTSGTTGRPLGVVLTHRNLTSSVEAAEDAVAFSRGESIVSFLPLNHVLARLADHLMPLYVGASVAHAGSARDLRPLVKAVRPHYLTLVPRVLDMFRGGVLSAMDRAPAEVRAAFERFFDAGLKRLGIIDGGGRPEAALEAICKSGDEVVFSRIREDMGLHRLKFFVSGGAPLSMETARFFRVLGMEVVEGYGLTETAALVTVNRPGQVRPGTVGPPVKGVEVRLGGDGEILARGGVVMEGYWNRPEETARAVDKEGWLHTGDMGEIDSNGHLRIKGRLKEIIVLSTGKNVSPLLVEERLCESAYISQAVVTGDGRSTLSALIVPDFARARAWLMEESGQAVAAAGKEASDEKVAEDPALKGLIRGEIKRLMAGLAEFERVKKFALLARPFTMEKGELTPTMKIRRRKVLERYAGVVEGLYG